jgi:hypothetical protein
MVAGLIWIGCQDQPDPTAPFDPSELLQDLRPAINVQERHTDRLLAIEGVIGTGVGLADNGRAAIRLFTTQPGIAGLPVELEGFPVEVKVTGLVMAYTEPTARQPRPVPTGVSTGHPAITAGTIGARVVDVFGNVYALSNNHVYANQNDAELGDPALQPGTIDGGTAPADQIGVLDSFAWIDFEGGANLMDAALVSTTKEMLGNSTPADDGYGTPSSQTAAAYIQQPVQKYGRTTGLTHGQVSDLNVTLNVCYEAILWLCFKQAKFVNQIGITPGTFSGGGDSGSLIVTDDENLNPVGLLFAGGETYTFANPIGPILQAFGVTIDDSGGEPPPPVTDVAVSSVSAPASVDQGTVVDVDVVVENVGNQDVADDITVTLNSNLDGQIGAAQTLNGLAAGASTTLTYQWTATAEGGHTLTATHNFADDQAGNNTASTTSTVVVPPTPLTDIAIASVTAPGDADEGTIVDVDVRVENIGNQDVGAFNVTLDGDRVGSIGSEAVGGLTAGSFTTVTFHWNTTGAGLGAHNLTATHDALDDVDTNDLGYATVTLHEPPPPPVEIHVGDIDVFSTGWSGRRWYANVRVFVHDDGHSPMEGVLVQGYWTVRNKTYASSCTTNTLSPEDAGRCTVARGNIGRRRSSVTFTVTSLTIAGKTYNAGENHDGDGDSNGTVITVYRPN